MDYKVFFATFVTIFLAELGDKTQLAAISLTADTKKPLAVFLGASLALVAVTLVAVLFGQGLTRFFGEKLIKILASICFITVGLFLLKEAIYIK
jgi:putative Ca2+/H+ antiporter (TMEM165/GDT1 family)